jgi:hypothetical protein
MGPRGGTTLKNTKHPQHGKLRFPRDPIRRSRTPGSRFATPSAGTIADRWADGATWIPNTPQEVASLALCGPGNAVRKPEVIVIAYAILHDMLAFCHELE